MLTPAARAGRRVARLRRTPPGRLRSRVTDPHPSGQATAYVGLGSNLGDRAGFIRAGLAGIGRLTGTRVTRCSSLYRTEPVGPVRQGEFLNAVCEVRTSLAPGELLAGLLRVEREHGRDRAGAAPGGPRTLDLDLLLFGEHAVDEPGCRVPHPRMHERRFVVEPLAEIAPDARVPGVGLSAAELLAGLRRAGGPGVERCRDGAVP